MQALVTFRTADGNTIELRSGDFIGRSWNAAWRISDPRISEAHAMVSLRGSVLKLLALRGRFAIEDRPANEVELRPGLAIWLTNDLRVEVVSIVLPPEVLALEGDGFASHVLSNVCSLRVEPRPTLLPGLVPDADATLWHDGLGWVIRIVTESAPSSTPTPPVAPPLDRPLVSGDSFQVAGRTFRAVSVALELAGHLTTVAVGAVQSPLKLVLRYDSAHIYREGEQPLALSGISARILSELAEVAQPLSWEALGREVWPDEGDLLAMRRKWDASIARLRQKLRDNRIRADLVRADGSGNFELLLYAGDVVDHEM
jgi:hypothetical protein